MQQLKGGEKEWKQNIGKQKNKTNKQTKRKKNRMSTNVLNCLDMIDRYLIDDTIVFHRNMNFSFWNNLGAGGHTLRLAPSSSLCQNAVHHSVLNGASYSAIYLMNSCDLKYDLFEIISWWHQEGESGSDIALLFCHLSSQEWIKRKKNWKPYQYWMHLRIHFQIWYCFAPHARIQQYKPHAEGSFRTKKCLINKLPRGI